MTKQALVEKKRILELAERDIVLSDDGYYYFWPTHHTGAYSEWHLRVIADELKARNEKWDKHVEEYFASQENKHITRILDVMYHECISAGGDGDAFWYSQYYTIEQILPLLQEYNSKLDFPFEIRIEQDNKTINWGAYQEWITITTDESLYLNAPSWSQFLLKS